MGRGKVLFTLLSLRENDFRFLKTKKTYISKQYEKGIKVKIRFVEHEPRNVTTEKYTYRQMDRNGFIKMDYTIKCYLSKMP